MPHAATEQAVYKQIAIDIASKVVNGRYRPGQKIHGRSTLASQYNVSPETVRRAVFLLNQVGVLQVRQGAGITILSVENAEEFLSKSNERQSLDTIKNHIDRLMLEQKQLNSRLQENINILLDANDRFNYLNPLTPFELAKKAARWSDKPSLRCIFGTTPEPPSLPSAARAAPSFPPDHTPNFLQETTS